MVKFSIKYISNACVESDDFQLFFSLLDFHLFQVFIAYILDPIDKYVDRNLYMKNETKKLIEGGIISLKIYIYI